MERICIYPALNKWTITQGNQIVDKGKIPFIEISNQYMKKERQNEDIIIL